MVSRAYQAGLLCVVFGGFLFVGGTGSTTGIGMLVMLLGLGVGVVGLLHESADEIQAGRVRSESE